MYDKPTLWSAFVYQREINGDSLYACEDDVSADLIQNHGKKKRW